MAIKMPPLHSQQLPRGVLPTCASTHSSRLCQESDEGMGNGEKGHLVTYFEDSHEVQPTTSTSAVSSTMSRNSNILVKTVVHSTGVVGG